MIIATEEELDTFCETFSVDFVLAVDAAMRPWLIYSTEEGLYAVSYPIESELGILPSAVTVEEMLTNIDNIPLPFTVIYTP